MLDCFFKKIKGQFFPKNEYTMGWPNKLIKTPQMEFKKKMKRKEKKGLMKKYTTK